MFSHFNAPEDHLGSTKRCRVLTISSETLSESVRNGAQVISERGPFEKKTNMV